MPYLFMAVVVQASGHLGDYLRCQVNISTEAVRKTFTCGGKETLNIAIHCIRVN